MVEPGGIYSAPTAIDIDISARLQARPRMGVLSHRPDCQLVGNAVIDAHTESAGRKIVALCVRIRVDIDKITESRHPHAPAVFRSWLEHMFDGALRGLAVQIHRRSVNFHVGTESAGSASQIIQTAFQV